MADELKTEVAVEVSKPVVEVVKVEETKPEEKKPEAKKTFTREELAQAVREELHTRTKRCMERIEEILREENCVLEAKIRLPEVSPGIFGITAEPGVRPM